MRNRGGDYFSIITQKTRGTLDKSVVVVNSLQLSLVKIRKRQKAFVEQAKKMRVDSWEEKA